MSTVTILGIKLGAHASAMLGPSAAKAAADPSSLLLLGIGMFGMALLLRPKAGRGDDEATHE